MCVRVDNTQNTYLLPSNREELLRDECPPPPPPEPEKRSRLLPPRCSRANSTYTL